MKRHWQRIGILVLLFLPSIAHAQRAGTTEQLPPGAPPAVQACGGCHGAQGEGGPGGPRLAGQPARYLAKQLESYTNGTRKSQVMEPIARGLPPGVRADVAQYYAALEVPRFDSGGKEKPPARGNEIANRGDNALGVQACRNCHGPDGVGEPPNIPYISGLTADYIVQQLRAWKEGARTNDAGQQMFTAVTPLSKADWEAVAQYYASLPPPKPAPSELVTTVVPAKSPAVAPGRQQEQPQGRVSVGQGGAGATTGGTQGSGGSSESSNIKGQGGGGSSEPKKSSPATPPSAWPRTIEKQAPKPQSSAPADPALGRALVASGTYGCPACHAIPNIRSARGIVGPPLEGMGTRALIAGRLPNDPATLAAFLMNAPALVPKTGMPNVGLTLDESRHIAAFLYTLNSADGR